MYLDKNFMSEEKIGAILQDTSVKKFISFLKSLMNSSSQIEDIDHHNTDTTIRVDISTIGDNEEVC